MNAEEMLSGVSLFRSLNKKHLAQLARLAVTQTYAPNQVIVGQGDTGLGLYVIVSGSVDVRKERPGQEPVSLNTLGGGQFFGEMSLLDDYPRSATVIAREETTCLTLSKWHFLSELESHPEIAVAILPVVARRLRDTLELLGAQT